MADEKEVTIDESLYSRQQIMLGEGAMKKMATANVFISGMGGLGVEIAKNIALAGVKLLHIHDTKNAQWTDLSTSFYLTPSDIGKNRAEACFEQISELNPYVKYAFSTSDLASISLGFFDQFKCVILTDAPLGLQLRINEYCHSKNIPFIASDARGIYCWCFDDFGEGFEVFDKNGEENIEVLVGNITKGNPAVVEILHGDKHRFEDGDVVTFREVQGMTEINGTTHKIKVISPTSFQIGDTSSFSEYKREGIVSQTKQTILHSFKPLKDSLVDPDIVMADFAKFGTPAQLHIAMQALDAFVVQHGRYPLPWNKEEAKEVVKLAEELNKKRKEPSELDVNLITRVAFTSQGSLAPLSAFMGGVVAQECLKALSGKYTPLQQWVFLDGSEAVPSLDTDPAEFQPQGYRNDGHVITLGRTLCEKLSNTKLFMIGCGAIGCEMLKNFAMLGVGTGKQGSITITDNDLIEKSNLNRQFLFRPKDIQQPKSVTAANAAIQMNPSLNVIAHQDKVGPDTEHRYTDEFFERQDLVVNALDNVMARLYVDGRIVTAKKPLLESGTLGPKGHVQVILPFKTESYSSTRDPPEKDVPFCTLKSFPSQIEHCIQWARHFSFEENLTSKPMQWNQLIEEENLVARLQQPYAGGIDLKVIRTASKLLKSRPSDFEDCLIFARRKFESYFKNKTIQLLHHFPLDHVIDQQGTLFWSSPKRPPKIIKFEWSDPVHQTFVITLANLWAQVWGVKKDLDTSSMRKIVESMKIPQFVPKSNKKIVTDENMKKEEAEKAEQSGQEEEIDTICKDMAKYFASNKPSKLNVLEFEKDDDTNFHVDFIASTANLRARMYSIGEVERLRVKAIAGRIMPAIATTTAAVSGCVTLELIKVVKGNDKLEDYKNLFMNLALPFWSFTEPGAVEAKKIVGDATFTLWDRWDVKLGDVTLQEFNNYFKKTYNLEVSGVFKGAIMIYLPILPGHKKRLTQKMSALLKPKPGTSYEDLIVTFANAGGEDVNGPLVRYYM